MSFLKKIFEKKPGGSLVGNALRGVSNNLSNGVLGNRSALTAWEIENGYRDALGNPTNKFNDFERGEMTPVQTQIAEFAVNGALETPEVKEDLTKAGVKKSLPWLLIAIVVGVALWLFKSKNSNQTTINNGSE